MLGYAIVLHRLSDFSLLGWWPFIGGDLEFGWYFAQRSYEKVYQ